MDWSHFGMTRRPFRPAVDTGAYFPAPSHEQAFAGVAAAFARREPVVVLDGPSGTGKSLVARRWLEHLPPDVPRVVLPNVHATRPADLLQAILFDLDEPYAGLTEQELRLAVTARLLTATESGHPTVLCVDEAQNLSHGALEELRLLGNVEARDGAALFALLVALPALREALDRPAYQSFAQRVATRQRVEPFTPDEAAAYLRHQVKAAGGDPARVIDDEAVAMLAGACGGVARVLNQAGGLAFELAAEAGAAAVDVEAALEALARLGLSPAAGESPAEPVVLSHPARQTGSADGPRAAGGGESRAARGPKTKSARKRSA